MFRNEVVLVGELQSNPAYKKIHNIKTNEILTICEFTLKVKEDVGEWVNYIPITAYGKVANAVVKYLSKGSRVTIKGKVKCNYRRENNKRIKDISIIGTYIIFGDEYDKNSRCYDMTKLEENTMGKIDIGIN